MVEGTAQEWFLEVEGRKTGPFATDQILGFFADHEVPGTARIISGAPGSEWTTVAELVAVEQKNLPPSLPSKPFVPPPRPAELQPATSPIPTVAKPELSLMDALRVNKERLHGGTKAIEIPKPESSQDSFKLITRIQEVPRKAWLIAATAALLLVATWGMTLFIKQKAPTVAAQPAPAAAPSDDSRPTPGGMAAVRAPAPLNQAPPSVTLPSSLSADGDRARERESEDQERENERERDLASSHDAASQYVAPMDIDNGTPPPPPPLPEPGLEAINPSAGMNLPQDDIVPPAPPPIE